MSDTTDDTAAGVHGEPTPDMCCLVTMEDITKQDGNYVEFQGHPSRQWRPALFEQQVVQQLLDSQFVDFVERVKTTDCQAELRRLLTTGPPVFLADANGFPLLPGDTHVDKLWYAADGSERTAKLVGAVEGDERDKLWNELREFLIEEGKEQGDEQEDGGK